MKKRAAGTYTGGGSNSQGAPRPSATLNGRELDSLCQVDMRKLVALPVLSADALSSVAYGPGVVVTTVPFHLPF